MKATLLTLCLLFANSIQASDLSEFYKQKDKQLHTKYSAIATNAMYVAGMTKWQAFTVMMVIGGIKETMDGDRNTQEEHHKDMLANMIGASTVFLTDWVLDLHSDRVVVHYRVRF